MILQSLAELYNKLAEQKEVPRKGMSSVKLTGRLSIDEEGELIAFQPVAGGKDVNVTLKEVPQQLKRSSNIAPNFLCDTAKYLLGIENADNSDRAVLCFEASKKLHHSILDSCDSYEARAILKFFDSWNPAEAKNDPALCELWDEQKQMWDKDFVSGNLLFEIVGEEDTDASDCETIMNAWDSWSACQKLGDNVKLGQCLVTGQNNVPIAVLHPSIKGVRGAQSSGATLVGFNSPAFESYGRNNDQGLNAPVSEDAVFRYTTALNWLLAFKNDHKRFMGQKKQDDKTKDNESKNETWQSNKIIGDTTVVFWSKSGTPQYTDVMSSISDGSLNNNESLSNGVSLKNIVQRICDGKSIVWDGVTLVPGETCYILGLAPNAARLSIRFFFRDTFGEFVKNINCFHQEMSLSRRDGKTKFVSMKRLLKSTANSHTKDSASSPLLAGALYRSVMTKQNYPEAVYQNILRRVFSEHDEVDEKGGLVNEKVGYERAAFIKAYLLRNKAPRWEEINMSVNNDCREVSYILGRLFSVLEEIQKEASSTQLNATIKDRYFNSACATPAIVFPVLLNLSNAHLKKIRATNPKNDEKFSNKICYLMNLIKMPDEGTPFPKRLSLEEQGAFILGYYQETQRPYNRTKNKEEENNND